MSNRTNRYNGLLYDALARLGVQAEEFSGRRVRGAPFQIVHFHWPEFLLPPQSGYLRGQYQLVKRLLQLRLVKARGAKLVWTVHNLQPHEGTCPRRSALLRYLRKHTDGFIFLCPSSLEAFRAQEQPRANQQLFCIPHGHYRDAYEQVARAKAREALQLPQDAFVFLWFGAMRKYKGLEALLGAFARLPGANVRLLVAGRPEDANVARAVEAAARADRRIVAMPRFVPDEEVATLYGAANLAVLPYVEVTNSGSAILALSLGVSVFASSVPCLRDLQKQVGEGHLRLHEGPATPEGLADALHCISTRTSTVPPDIFGDDWNWPSVAQRTLDAYQSCLAQR